jgi:hypothetical protein
MRIMPPITGRRRQVGVLDTFAADMQRTRESHLHRTSLVKPGNYYAGHHKAQGVLVTVTRSGRRRRDKRGSRTKNPSESKESRKRQALISAFSAEDGGG